MTSQVFNCDCIEYMRTIPDKFFDLSIADPPYRDKNSPTKWMLEKSSSKEMFIKGIPEEEFFSELKRVSRNQIIWGANNFGHPFSGFIAWDKQVRGSRRYSQVEIAAISDGLSSVSSFVSINCYDNGKIHPTQKPVALYAWILEYYAKPGDKIFDPMMGSQSSRIAAYKMGFDFVGCELDPDYFAEGCSRFDKECNGIEHINGKTITQMSLF